MKVNPRCQMGTPVRGYGPCSGRIIEERDSLGHVYRFCSGHIRQTCRHDSMDGVDQTPNDDPTKVWKCMACGARLLAVRDAERPWLTRIIPAQMAGSQAEERA